MLRTISSTKPLQDMSDPMEKDSRQTSPFNRAASAHPINLALNATIVTAMRYPQVMLLSSNPKLVFNPDNVKYSGRKSAPIKSSIFSVTLMANPPS
jgi:hypothetical protein